MGKLDIRIAPAAMGPDHAVLVPEPLEQHMRVMRIARLVREIRHLRMRGAIDRPPLLAKEHVPVPADRGVRRPLIARDRHEPPGLVQPRGQRVQILPERPGDLEVVALMRTHIHEGPVAGEQEVGLRRVGAERLVGLPVQIPPEMQPVRRLGDAQRIAPAKCGTRRILHRDHQVLARLRREPVQHQRKGPGLEARHLRQPRHRARGDQPQVALPPGRSDCPRHPPP